MLKEFGIEGIYIVHASTGYEIHEQRINEIFGKLYKTDEGTWYDLPITNNIAPPLSMIIKKAIDKLEEEKNSTVVPS